MKHLFKFALAAVLVVLSSATYGQKFGYINSNELLSIMPELDSVQIKLSKIEEDYRTQLETIQVEWNNKFNDLQKTTATNSDAINQMKQKELTDLQQRYEDYQNLAREELTNTQNELMQPIVERANNAIAKVGQDNGFLVIFDRATGPIVYFDAQQVTDVLPLVKTELGITDAKK